MRLATVILALGAALAAPLSAASAQTKLNLGYGSAGDWIAAFVAKDRGIFAKNGLDVTMTYIPSGSNQPAALVAGTIDVGTFNPPLLFLADEGGMDIEIVAGATSDSDPGQEVWPIEARTGTGIKSAADFRGKRIGIPGRNNILHVALMKWLKENGVDPRQVNYVEIGMPHLSDMLAAGQIEGAVSVAPFSSQIEERKTGYRVGLLPVAFSFYGMTRSYIAKNPSTVIAFRTSIAEAADWANKNLDEARKTQITYLKLPPAVAMSAGLPVFTAAVDPEAVRKWLDLCKELGVTKGTLTVQEVVAK